MVRSCRTARSAELTDLVRVHRDAIDSALRDYAASNPRLFGSVAAGTATAQSDIDILVDIKGNRADQLMGMLGLSTRIGAILGIHVDVVTRDLLRDPVAADITEVPLYA